jgi:Flp pilus assembly protein TadD
MTVILPTERPVETFGLRAGRVGMPMRQDDPASDPAPPADNVVEHLDGDLLQARALSQTHSGSPTAQARLASSEFSFGHRLSALEAARRVLGHDPVDAPALMVVASIFAALGEIAYAREAVNELLAADTPDIGSRSAAAVLAARIAAHEGDPREALELLAQSDTQAALALKGALLVQVGRYHDAIRVLREALSDIPDDPDALGALGYAYAAVGSIGKAARAMRAAAALDPTDRSAGLNVAALLISQDQAADAVAVIDRLIGHHSHDIGLERSAAAAMHASGDTAGALRRLRRVKTSRAARNASAARRQELGLDILLLDTPPMARSEVFAAAAAALRRCDYRSEGITRTLVATARTTKDLSTLETAYRELRKQDDAAALRFLESKVAFLRLEFDRCTEAAVEWAHHEPFSVDAHITATYMLSLHAGDYQQAAHLGRAGLRRGIQHDALRNNVAFALAMDAKPDEAALVLPDPTACEPALATAGLIEMVRGDLDRGASLYEDCARRLRGKGHHELADLVSIHRVLAEITAGRRIPATRLSGLADTASATDPDHAIVWTAIAREQSRRA